MLEQPSALSDGQWNAVREHEERLRRSLEQRDHAQAVGSAKELCETIARLVAEVRGETFVGNDYGSLVSFAHGVLQRQPGVGVATDGVTRDMAQGVKTLATQLGLLRNALGTGHGQSRAPSTLEEHAVLASEAALLWARWALRRLDELIVGRPAELVRDLSGAGTFGRGDLARRLEAADIPQLAEGEAHRLGVAIGQRTARNTFMVAIEGVDGPLAGDVPWPTAYRRGVLEGLVVDADGRVSFRSEDHDRFVQVVRSLGEEAVVSLDQLASEVAGAEWSYRTSAEGRTALDAALADIERDLGGSIGDAAQRLRSALAISQSF